VAAVDFLIKPFREQQLLDATYKAIDGDRRQRRHRFELEELRGRYRRLTSREREVMTLVVAGRLNKQIAAEIGISQITVKMHRTQVMRKMGVKSLPDLVRIAEKLK
jgi:FixJ family two-component response regulator